MFHQGATHEHLVWNCAKICILVLHAIDLQNAHVSAQKSFQILTLHSFRIGCRDAFKPKLSFLFGGAGDSCLHSQVEQQPMTWEDAFNFTTISWHHDEQKPITVGSWNVNALLSHVQQAAATPCDILAIQEVRICKEQHTVRAALRNFGYNLYHGTLPQVRMQGSLKMSLHVDQLIPGVALLIKDYIPNIPVHEITIPTMEKWYEGGRFLALKIFLSNFGKAAPTLMTWPARLRDLAHQDAVFFGDINQDSKEGAFVQEAQSYGWLPLTMCMDYEFCTYEHPNGGQSAIDTIIVSDSLKEMVSPLDCLQILDKGHKLIYTNFLSSYKNATTWETAYVGKPVFEVDSSSNWQSALEFFWITLITPLLIATGVCGVSHFKNCTTHMAQSLVTNPPSESEMSFAKTSFLLDFAKPYRSRTGLPMIVF